jgi:cyclic pyranopterin phosphate synthase
MLVDRYGRAVKYLRISVTSRCNLNCIYCHNEGEVDPDGDMSVDEIKRICKAFYDLGVRKVKITGGEPLIRKDIVDLVAEMPPFEDISLVTNGTFLAKKAYDLKEAGLDRVNVSLDTLREDRYEFISGKRMLKKVVDGIYTAYDAGLTPIKLNMVVLRGINDDEIDDLIRFSASFNKSGIDVIVQLIEVVGHPEYYYDLSKIEEKYKALAERVIVRGLHSRRQYIFKNSAVEFICPFHKEFCMHCNRIRVTSDGKIKPCLLRNDNLINIRNLNGEELIKAIKRAVELREPYVKD